ncbi:hypothetical protein DYU05_02990 [Mucilaginibacter terrenus]|uniref:DUF3820 family protein n=1 Tax=Mucilaginibacter terrenus TaxID=2482727 RepID=A0A3E2NYN8_9SPHI|nr:hypothetical protein DYU05_02990 [Mucilaginibacter terrenus]
MGPDPQLLIDIVKTKMPFGKYKDTLVCDIPVSYLEWMHRKNAFPEGKLGMLMRTAYEIKINGLDKLLWALKDKTLK